MLGWHLSRSGKSTTAASALEHALINRFGTLGKVTREFLLRSDNGLVFTSHKYTALVRSYGLKQEFITPHSRFLPTVCGCSVRHDADVATLKIV